jgi:NTE family protein
LLASFAFASEFAMTLRLPERLRAYVSFSGGGAMGIVHLGGLRAIEEAAPPGWASLQVATSRKQSYIDVQGHSGTSAVAMVAALAAAGYTSSEIVGHDGRTNILDTLRRTVTPLQYAGPLGIPRPFVADTITSLFGPLGWTTISILRLLAGNIPLKALAVLLGASFFG